LAGSCEKKGLRKQVKIIATPEMKRSIFLNILKAIYIDS